MKMRNVKTINDKKETHERTKMYFQQNKKQPNTHLRIIFHQLLEQFRRPLPQGLARLVQALLVANVLPQLRLGILLQKPPRRVEAAHLIDNDRAKASFLRLGTGNVGYLVLLYEGSEVFVADVVIDVVAPAGQDVVIVRGNDAFELRPRRVRLGVQRCHGHRLIAS